MCGIAGLATLHENSEKYITCIQAMTDAQQHRGPDGAGLDILNSFNPMIAFGHRRLAIIDLSVAGRQPMYDSDAGNWITFNGELYNFRELRRELEQLGQLFGSQTDTEVILKAYATWGQECVLHLRGIFAFGIWNQRSRILFLARDQIGVKPLYYWQNSETLLFASEVRALLSSGIIPRKLDLEGLHSFMAYGSVQEPYTLVQDVRSLLPGHTLTWHEGQLSIKCYWQLPTSYPLSLQVPNDLYQQVQERLADAVCLQLVADVPLGAFLSGGIDSTAIAALAQQASDQPIKTFSLVFDEAAYDERVYSQIAARHIGTSHTELCLTADMVTDTLPQALTSFDQPSVDGLNTYFISKVTREAGLTVALSGVGGDELFGGYNGYHKPLLAEQWGKRAALLPEFARIPTSKILTSFVQHEKLRKLADLLSSPQTPYFLTRRVFSALQVIELLKPEILKQSENWTSVAFERLIAKTSGYDSINRVSALELQTYMLSTLLRDTDQMSMAHALEVRVPLLDHKLIEYLFMLPGSCKLHSQQPKPLLTFSLDSRIPKECVYRPKRGFELPLNVWLKQTLHSQVKESLTYTPVSHGIPFQSSGLKRIWKQFEKGELGWSRVWGLFVLQTWLAEHKVTI